MNVAVELTGFGQASHVFIVQLTLISASALTALNRQYPVHWVALWPDR